MLKQLSLMLVMALTSRSADRPNIVLIMADDLGIDSVEDMAGGSIKPCDDPIGERGYAVYTCLCPTSLHEYQNSVDDGDL